MPESRMEALFGEQHHWELERMIPAHPRGEGAHDSRPTFLYVPNLNVYLSKIILTPIERSQVHVLTPTSTGSFSFGFCLGGFPGVVGGTFFEALLGVLLIVFVGPFAFQLFMVSIVLVAVFQQWTADICNWTWFWICLALFELTNQSSCWWRIFKPHPQEFTDRVPDMPCSKSCPKVNWSRVCAIEESESCDFWGGFCL